MRRFLSWIQLSMLASLSVALQANEPPRTSTAYFADDPAKWASPETVLPPVYPKAALEKGVKATVDVVVNIKDTGRLESIAEIQSEPKDAAFEAAVQEVLRHWRFAQSYDASCRPVAAQSRLRVWFDIKDGQPSISVTHVPAPVAPGTLAIKVINRDELRGALRGALVRILRSGPQPGAEVYAKLIVEPQTGVTKSVEIVTMAGSPQLFQKPAGLASTTSREPSLVVQYGVATKAALQKARFEPGAAAGDAPVGVCYAVSYNMNKEEKS